MIDEAVRELGPVLGVRHACEAVGETQARWYRRHRFSRSSMAGDVQPVEQGLDGVHPIRTARAPSQQNVRVQPSTRIFAAKKATARIVRGKPSLARAFAKARCSSYKLSRICGICGEDTGGTCGLPVNKGSYRASSVRRSA